MPSGRRILWAGGLAAAALIAAGVVLAPRLIGSFWEARSSNPVRRGIARAQQLGCFTCHGNQGKGGIRDPGYEGGEVPAWSGGVWMMYLEDEQEIREFILDGISKRRAASFSSLQEREYAAIAMPAYRDVLRGSDLDDLTAAFLVLSRMIGPAKDTPEERGWRLARHWQCLDCHGPGASGGNSNPGSFAGYIPGWYGSDFDDLVRDRAEFDAWIRDGNIERLISHPIASRFIESQRVRMPGYPDLTQEELDDLWAYAVWLKDTGGGIRIPVP
jgi:mono/diheme cytochrome c family protein